MRRILLRLAVALVFALGLTTLASAGPIYLVRYDRTPLNFDPFETIESSSPEITTQGTFFEPWQSFPNQFTEGDWFARANQGVLFAAISANRNFQSGSNYELQARASFLYDDLIFSSAEDMLIDVTLPLHLSGSLTTSTVATRVTIEADLMGQDRGGSYRPATGDASGLLGGLSGGVIDTTLFADYTNIPTNTPVSLFLLISTDMFINGNNSAFADFGSSYGFISGGPTFIVPDGVNVDSDQAGIVNNQFSGTAPVPEPSSLILLLLGGTPLACWIRRRNLMARKVG